MDRLISLRNSQANSVLNNASMSSELGYETAQDDSISSMYYSFNNDTLTEEVDDTTPPPTTTTAPEAFESTETNQIPDNSIKESILTESSTQTLMTESIESADHLTRTILSSNSDDVAENFIDAGPDISTNQELNTIGLDAITTAQNLFFNFPSGSAVSSTNITNFAGSSNIVQELYVVTMAQQQTNRVPELSRGKKFQNIFVVRVNN